MKKDIIFVGWVRTEKPPVDGETAKNQYITADVSFLNEWTMKEIVNVLWTGGLDSTYLVVKLLYMGMTVQPYYIIDEGRKSLKKELNAIRKISQHLQDHNVIKGQLLTTIIIYEKSINAYKDITDSWKRLNKKYSLGRQYDWLARFSRQQRKKLMVGVMMENRGKVIHTLEGKEMQKIKVSGIDVFTITNEISDMNHDAFIVFHPFAP